MPPRRVEEWGARWARVEGGDEEGLAGAGVGADAASPSPTPPPSPPPAGSRGRDSERGRRQERRRERGVGGWVESWAMMGAPILMRGDHERRVKREWSGGVIEGGARGMERRVSE